MARYNPENKPVEEFIASIEDHSWIKELSLKEVP